MGESKVLASRADHRDARGLAVLDSWRDKQMLDDDYVRERRNFWKECLANEKERRTAAYIARDGGLHVGYLALLNQDAEPPVIELVFGPKAYNTESITRALLEKAGIEAAFTTMHEPNNLAVA